MEYGTNLVDWSTAEPSVDGVTITENDDVYGDGIDQVIVSIPVTLAPDGILFARLKVSMP